ncbi:hypothetical protein WN944_027323 [Citrus x changshan-huyou]|uniref:Uncharacterized protein n=1 Tax=Citrus x changshan-huyou TaxID=2935761 RepID=A0AAP0LJT4_9ROSI
MDEARVLTLTLLKKIMHILSCAVDRPFNLGNLTMDWERRKWDLMVGIVGGKLQKKDDVFKVEGPF